MNGYFFDPDLSVHSWIQLGRIHILIFPLFFLNNNLGTAGIVQWKIPFFHVDEEWHECNVLVPDTRGAKENCGRVESLSPYQTLPEETELQGELK
jgi:hypothetical protein